MLSFLPLLAIACTVIASIFIIYQDFKDGQFHIFWAALFLLGSSLWSYVHGMLPINGLYLIAFSLVLQAFWIILMRKPAFGAGDIVLLSGVGFWISNIFLFIFLCGLMGVLTKIIFPNHERFPFAPAIILAGVLTIFFEKIFICSYF